MKVAQFLHITNVNKVSNFNLVLKKLSLSGKMFCGIEGTQFWGWYILLDCRERCFLKKFDLNTQVETLKSDTF